MLDGPNGGVRKEAIRREKVVCVRVCVCVCIPYVFVCMSWVCVMSRKKKVSAFRPGLYGERAGVIVDRKQGNIILYQVNLYIQLLPIFYFFVSI